MTDPVKAYRDQHPHRAAVLAMYTYCKAYAQSGLGSMGFWDSLGGAEKRVMREGVQKIIYAQPEKFEATGMTIATAALRIGKLIITMDRPARHHNLLGRLVDLTGKRWGEAERDRDQGFLTSTGFFVSRTDALKIANEAGQLLPSAKWQLTNNGKTRLMTEDLW